MPATSKTPINFEGLRSLLLPPGAGGSDGLETFFSTEPSLEKKKRTQILITEIAATESSVCTESRLLQSLLSASQISPEPSDRSAPKSPLFRDLIFAYAKQTLCWLLFGSALAAAGSVLQPVIGASPKSTQIWLPNLLHLPSLETPLLGFISQKPTV
ncbi:hypothetical protein U1Q18_001505 [Sarracenia purpurea var. burkii]